MNSQTTPNRTTGAANEIAIRAVIQRMVDAWNEGSGEVFAAPFGETADFIAFEGNASQGTTGDHFISSANLRHGGERNAPRRRGKVRTHPQPSTGRDALGLQDDAARADRTFTVARLDTAIRRDEA